MISLLFDGYAGGHLSKTPGASVVPWRGRVADPTVERGHKMCLTHLLTDPLHGKEAHHLHPLTTGALRRGKWQDPARGGYQTSACPPRTQHWSMAMQNRSGEWDPNCSAFPGHLVANPCLLGIEVSWLRADKSKQSHSWGSEYPHMCDRGFAWVILLYKEMPALFLLSGRNVSN